MDTLKKYGLTLRESDNPDRLAIDFSIEDDNDNVAWVWGTPEDYSVECDHAVIDYGDDDEQGRCVVCGQLCDWHYEKDEGNVEDYHWSGQERVPHGWHDGDGGLIKQYIGERYNSKN